MDSNTDVLAEMMAAHDIFKQQYDKIPSGEKYKISWALDEISIDHIFDSIEETEDMFLCFTWMECEDNCDCCKDCNILEAKVIKTTFLFDRASRSLISGTMGHIVLDDYNWDSTEWCIKEVEKTITQLEDKIPKIPTWQMSDEMLSEHYDLNNNKYALQMLKWLLNSERLICVGCNEHLWK